MNRKITVKDVGASSYTLHHNISRFIKKMFLKYPNGLKGVIISHAILSTIRNSRLTYQDIRYLIALENESIINNIMWNTEVSDKIKYHMILKNVVPCGVGYFSNLSCVLEHLLSHIKDLEKYYYLNRRNTILWVCYAAYKRGVLYKIPNWAKLLIYLDSAVVYLNDLAPYKPFAIEDIIKASKISNHKPYKIRDLTDNSTISSATFGQLKELIRSIDKSWILENLSCIVDCLSEARDLDFIMCVIKEAIIYFKEVSPYSSNSRLLEKIVELYDKEKGGE